MKRLRYFFDPGSGVCLWAASDSARKAFGYAVDHDALPLSAATKAQLTELVTRFDASIDWDCPTERGPAWTMAAARDFLDDADRGLRMLVDELGSAGFEIVAEHRRATSAGA
jgi:hypothetical protein